MSEALAGPEVATVATGDIVGVLRAALLAAARGVKVYMTAGVYARLKELLDELGIAAREVEGEIADSDYVLIRAKGPVVVVEIYEGGRLSASATTTPGRLVELLRRFLAPSRPSRPPASTYYVIEVPAERRDELLKALKAEPGDGDRGKS